MKVKALVKKTGEILDIVDRFKIGYSVVNIDLSKYGDSTKGPNDKNTFVCYEHVDIDSSSRAPGNYICLSNGKSYIDTELVVGEREIREYRLSNYLNEDNK